MKREKWFGRFISEDPDPNDQAILSFHIHTGDGDPDSDLVMDRGFVRTKSVTQITVNESVDIYYRDLEKEIAERLLFRP